MTLQAEARVGGQCLFPSPGERLTFFQNGTKWLRYKLSPRTTDPPDSTLTYNIRRLRPRPKSPRSNRKKPESHPASPSVGVLSLARSWSKLIGQPGITNRADLAAHLGISRARVSQVLTVLDVPALEQDMLATAEAAGRPVTERTWRRIRPWRKPARAAFLHDRVRSAGKREHREQPDSPSEALKIS